MNKASKIIIVVLCLVIISLLVILFIDNRNDNSVECISNNKISQTFENYANNMTKSINNMKKQTNEDDMENEKIVINNYDDYLLKDIESVEINSLGEAYLNIIPNTQLFEKYSERHKIKSDVLSVNICKVGQNNDSYIYLVNKDGTVSYIDSMLIYSDELIEVKNIEGLKDIINIIQTKEFETYKVKAVDVYGNINSVGK